MKLVDYCGLTSLAGFFVYRARLNEWNIYLLSKWHVVCSGSHAHGSWDLGNVCFSSNTLLRTQIINYIE